MSEALYRKYRPEVFLDVVGQTHVLQTLKNAIDSNKISHAYLFCGPRGTGKTTMARILAKACLCTESLDGKSPTSQPCGKCQDCQEIAKGQHPDVYELDAASRTGVENVRDEIISRVQFAATRGKKKIYIIDEVHMLSTAAFNALLKTLEEPPEHVIFVLCTTDPQKVPETILSRCQRFDFKPINTDEIANRLQYVCEKEDVKAQNQALQLIAQNAQGGMRNALTQLEQLISFSEGEITIEDVNSGFSQNSNIDVKLLLENIGKRDLPGSFAWVENYCKEGADFVQLTSLLTQAVRDMFVCASGGHVSTSNGLPAVNLDATKLFLPDRLHRMMVILGELATELKTSANARLSFEVALARMTRPKSDITLDSLAERIEELENAKIKANISALNVLPAQNQDTQTSDKFYPVQDAETSMEAEPSIEEYDPEVTDFNSEQEAVSQNKTKETVKKMPKKKINSYKDNPAGAMREDVKKNTDLKFRHSNRAKEEQEKEKVEHQKEVLVDPEALQRIWHRVYAGIKRKFPAYAAILMTGNPVYDSKKNIIVLQFPESSNFAITTLRKPDVREKIIAEIKEVTGQNFGFDCGFANNDDKIEFNPSYTDVYREQKAPKEEPPQNQHNETVNQDTSKPEKKLPGFDTDALKNKLESLGAFNITEE